MQSLNTDRLYDSKLGTSKAGVEQCRTWEGGNLKVNYAGQAGGRDSRGKGIPQDNFSKATLECSGTH